MVFNHSKESTVKKGFVFAHAIVITAFSLANAQPSGSYSDDHVFAGNGGAKVTLATGIPYVGIAEYAYGFSDRVTGGILFGVTPNVEGYGVRVRAVVYQTSKSFRVYFCTPVLYYPKTKALGGDPWWLARPNINFEWIAENKFRYKVGGSLIAAASQHSLFGNPADAKFKPGLWNAFHVGTSFPVGSEIMFQTELSVVMNGFKVAGDDWVGGPPVILITGISYEL